jgi:hypothetical protein
MLQNRLHSLSLLVSVLVSVAFGIQCALLRADALSLTAKSLISHANAP